MKKNNVAMILILVILLSITLIGTYAYQMYTQDTIKNTFTVGNVSVDFYEKDGDNKIKEDKEYKLERGTEYSKNMVVSIGQGSEACYVFIVFQNDLKDVEATTSQDYIPVETQITNYGWELYKESGNVKVYKKYIMANSGSDYEINFINSFRTADSFDYDKVRKENNESPLMTFTIYAIEKGDLTVANAWDLLGNEYNELKSY